MTALIKGTAAITKAIDSISNRGKRLDSDIQIAGLSILAHIEEHGDVTLANRLFDALPKGARRLALAEWFLAFGKLAANADKAAVKAGTHFLYAKDKATDMAAAAETPWYDFRQEKSVAEAFDLQAEVQRLLKKLQRAQDSGADIKHAELAEQLTKLVAV